MRYNQLSKLAATIYGNLLKLYPKYDGLDSNLSRGKESILLNLGSTEGRATLDNMIARVDIVTFNGTDAQRDALGLDPVRLHQINPRLILAQLDAFGGPAQHRVGVHARGCKPVIIAGVIARHPVRVGPQIERGYTDAGQQVRNCALKVERHDRRLACDP